MPRKKKQEQTQSNEPVLSLRQKKYRDYLAKRLDDFISNNPEPSKTMQAYIDSIKWNIENVNKLFK